jgi:phosphomannomutase/phosphoglucomutase
MALLTRRQIITAARKSLDEPQGGDTPAATELVADAQSVVATTDQEAEIPDHPDDGLPAHIFRSTEIRGRTEDELTDEFMERICKSLAVVAQRRGVQTLAIACDGQGGSDRLRTIAVKTLLASGRDVIDLGAAPAPLLYFATRETEYDSGILITGGRGDEGVNGLRVVMQRQLLTQQGIQEILQGIRDGLQEQGSGRTIKFDVEADYLDKIALDIGVAVPLKIVVDSNFGLAAGLAHEVFGALGCEILSYNDPEQGRVRPEDWAIADALEVLGDKVRSEGADLGLLFDSNGDRLLTVTDQGTAVATDQLMMILGKDFLDRNPGADLVYDVQCTRHFAPFITRSGGRGVMSKSGHANVWAKMVQSKALMGVEYSGHLFLADRWYGFNDAVYAAARLVELLSMSGGSYQDLLSELPGYVSSGVLTVHMDPRERRELLRDLTQEPDFPGSRVTTLDGLRVDYSDSWGLVQASTTYDTLNFRFEGNDEEAMQRVMAVIRKAVQSRMPDLQLPF